jgi:hypothetical protein
MINLTYMISILNSIFTVMFYAMRRSKLDLTYICLIQRIFKSTKFILNLYIYIIEQDICVSWSLLKSHTIY